jgi:tetratricopeptide (TPR) repeat protein
MLPNLGIMLLTSALLLPAEEVLPTAEGGLPREAQSLADAGRPIDAWNLLTDRVGETLRAGRWDGGMATAETEIALLQLISIAGQLDAWPETAARIEAWLPLADDVPPHVAFLAQYLYSTCLRNVGRHEEARAISGALGYQSDYLIVGPFDNERGSGMAVTYAPETAIDIDTPMLGKERAVRWRSNPGRHHPLRRIVLGQMMDPNDQSVAYLATALVVDEPRDVVLRLGTSSPFEVILNGREELARKVERPRTPDQDLIVLALSPGVNQLLIKSGVEDGNWSLETRFTGLDGSPVTDLVVDSARVADPTLESRYADGTRAPEARDILEEMTDDAEAARLLALYHLLVHPDDTVDRSARFAAELALELEPDDVPGLYLLARANHPEGASKEEMQVNPRVHALKAVLERDPEHVAALLDLADFAADLNPTPSRVDELTERALRAAPESWRAMNARVDYLRSRDRDAEADVLQARALQVPEASLRVSGALARFRRLRWLGQQQEAIAELAAGFERQVLNGTIMRELVDHWVDAGEYERARETTLRVMAGTPYIGTAALHTAGRLEDAGDLAGARELVELALEIRPEHLSALHAMVRLHERAGNVTAAAEVLAEIVRLDSGDSNARRHREMLLQEGEKDRFEAPYRTDAVALADTPLPSDENSEPVEVLDRTTVWSVQPDGTEHVYEHIVMRALTQGGVKQLDTYSIWAPGGATPKVYNVRVIHPDGSFERAPSPRGGGGGWYDLPPLRPGDLVDVEYRIDQREADVFGQYFGARHEFYADVFDGLVPTRRSELVVIAPAEVPIHVSERRAESLEHSKSTDEQGRTVMRWVARDLPRPAMQSGMPGRGEFAPVVDVTTFRDWDEFAQWWWSFIEKEFVTTPAMREKVVELTADLPTEAEKVEAVARFVGQEIRYNAWPFGTHGYEPFSAATIFERRFGDCKDKSILLKQMLAEIGVEAVPVLINAEYNRAEEPLDAAMVGLFNHCIAYLPETDDRPGYYLDATADHNPVDYLRADDQGARVLHVTPEGGEIHDIPYAPPEQNALRRHYTITLDHEGRGEVSLLDESNGHYGVRMRYRYAGEQGDLETTLSRALADAFGQVDIRQVETSDLEDITVPARLEATFVAQNLWTPQGGLRALRLGFDDVGLSGVAAESDEQRVHDIVLDRPFAQDTTIVWHLPEGAEAGQLPRDVDIEAPDLLIYRQRSRLIEPGVIEVTRHFELLRRRIAREEYAGFRKVLRDVQQAEERTVSVTPAPPSEGR